MSTETTLTALENAAREAARVHRETGVWPWQGHHPDVARRKAVALEQAQHAGATEGEILAAFDRASL